MSHVESTLQGTQNSQRDNDMQFLDRLGRRFLIRRLTRLRGDRLTLTHGDERYVMGDAVGNDSLNATIEVLDARFFSDVAFGGAVGAAEAYMRGYWVCDDLTTVVRILVKNRAVLEEMDRGGSLVATPVRKFLHALNRNSRTGSRKNIAAHYDLGNDFFRLWLDESMMYSSAVFPRSDTTLEQASVAKLERICQKLELCADDHVLEIGSGWGGFAIHAAANYGCRVTTTTISQEQYDFAQRRVDEAGLGDRITLLLKDYRDLDGQYDKLVSIEMIEAVGFRYLDDYFETCSRMLKPHGMMLLQAITIADQRFKTALKSVDFIQRYIFPGGFLPSVTAMLNSITEASDLRLFHLEDVGDHYARTLRCWRDRFFRQLAKVQAMGYSDEFIRMWNYYLCYCEGAFVERAIGNVHMLLVKPDCRRPALVPALVDPGIRS